MIIGGLEDEHNFVGWIETRRGFHSFSASLISDVGLRYGLVDTDSLVVDDDLRNILRPFTGEAWFLERMGILCSPKSFTAGFQKLVNEITSEAVSRERDHLLDSALPLLLMKHLDEVGWDRVVKVNEDFTVIQLLSIDREGREHLFDIIINPNYPTSCPSVYATLPAQINVPWSKTSSLRHIAHYVDNEIKMHSGLFQELEEIDSLTWVLEPSQPNFSTTIRRLAIEKSCSIVLELDAQNPRDICTMNFFGPPNRVNTFRISLNKNIHLWSKDRSVRENIEILLGFPLPSRETATSDNLSEECGICYAYSIVVTSGAVNSDSSSHNENNRTSHVSDIATKTQNTAVPDQICSNTKCCKVYHSSCLVDWLHSLASCKTSFGTIFGSCPYCQEAISVRVHR